MTHLIEKHKTKNVQISRSQNVPNNWIQFRAAHLFRIKAKYAKDSFLAL